MRKTASIFLLVASFLSVSETGAQQQKEIGVAAKNVERGRTTFMSYDNRDVALANDYTKSKYMIPLEGKWKFIFADDARDIPRSSVASPAVNSAGWNDIVVPGAMELQGYGKPAFCYEGYDFTPSANSLVGDKVSAGVYKTKFDLTLMWFDRDIFLHLGSFKSAVYVYVNGQEVGYSENTGTPTEFRINNYVVEGQNDLTIIVHRHSPGSYLESAEALRTSGLLGETYIFSQPKNRINDYKAIAVLDSTNYSKGILKLDIELKNSFNGPENVVVYYDLLNSKGEIIKYYFTEHTLSPNSLDTLHHIAIIPNVQKWSAEDPNLYTVIMRMKKEGRFLEYIPIKIGFRSSEIIDGQYLINGKPAKLNGVVYNRHHASQGNFIDKTTLIKDLKLMKQNKINAIRTETPMPPFFYELCDEYGIYVCDQANIDASGFGQSIDKDGRLVNNPDWQSRYKERVKRMYEANRNYASVVMWSLGGDKNNGINAQESYLQMKILDSLRPVVFAGAGNQWNTDIVFPSFTKGTQLEQLKDDRPLMLSGLADSNNGLFDDLKDRFPGGFLSRWVDEGLFVGDAKTGYWSYDSALSNRPPAQKRDALVSADRKPLPALKKMSALFSAITFKVVDGATGVLRVTNGESVNLNQFTFAYNLYAGNKIVKTGTLAISLTPGASKNVTVPMSGVSKRAGIVYAIELTAKSKIATTQHPKGEAVLMQRLEL